MKIALVLNGVARDVLAGSTAFEQHLFQDHSVDVFACVWPGEQSQLIPDTYSSLRDFEIMDPAAIADCVPSRFNVFSNWYGIQKACHMVHTYTKQNSVAYDWIVRTRPDIELQFDVEWPSLAPGCYWTSSCHWGNRPEFAVDDNIAVCRSDLYFKAYSDLYNWYCDLPVHFNHDPPEIRLAQRMHQLNISEQIRRHMSLDYIVARHPRHG